MQTLFSISQQYVGTGKVKRRKLIFNFKKEHVAYLNLQKYNRADVVRSSCGTKYQIQFFEESSASLWAVAVSPNKHGGARALFEPHKLDVRDPEQIDAKEFVGDYITNAIEFSFDPIEFLKPPEPKEAFIISSREDKIKCGYPLPSAFAERTQYKVESGIRVRLNTYLKEIGNDPRIDLP